MRMRGCCATWSLCHIEEKSPAPPLADISLNVLLHVSSWNISTRKTNTAIAISDQSCYYVIFIKWSTEVNSVYLFSGNGQIKEMFSFFTRHRTESSTVEPHHTTTPLKRPPLYYDHFFMARAKANTLSYLKTLLIRPPRYYDQRPPFGVLSPYFLYKITPLIRPVKLTGQEVNEDTHNLTNNELKFYSIDVNNDVSKDSPVVS